MAEKPVHGHARSAAIIRFQRMKWHFDVLMNERRSFRKPDGGGSPIPDDDNFINVEQSWRGMLEAADAKDVMLRYKVPASVTDLE